MEFTIDRETLKTELGLAAGCLEKKSIIPILQNVLLKSLDDETVEMTVTDLDLTFTAILSGTVKKQGAVCIEARKLADIVNRAVSDEIKIKSDKDFWARVEAGASKYRLAGSDAETFPSLELEDIEFNTVWKGALLEALNAVSYAVNSASESQRFTMSGVKFILNNKEMTAVATDGHRLAVNIQKDTEICKSAMDSLIPKKAVSEFQKHLNAIDDDNVEIGEEKNHIVLKSEARTIIARKLVGKFPNYEMMFPKENKQNFTIKAQDLSDAIKRVVICTDSRKHDIWFHIADGKLELKAESAEEGEANEILNIDFTGEPVKLGFQHRYMTEALDYLGEDDCFFTFKDEIVQIELKRAGSDDFRYIISLLRF